MLLALLIKEFKHLLRNRLLLGLVTMYPIVILFALPWATNMDIDSLRAVIVSPRFSSVEQRLSQKIFASGYFVSPNKDHPPFLTPDGAMSLLEEDKTDIIITIPQNFEKDLVLYGRGVLELKVNAINATKGVLGSAYLQSIVQDYVREDAEQRGLDERLILPTEAQDAMLYNPTKSYRSFIIPGLITILITLITFIIPALNLVEEKEFGTIEQMNVSPIRRHILLFSKMLPYVFLAVLMIPFAVLVTGWVYDIWPVGNVLVIMLGTLIYSFALTGLGLTVANTSRTQQQTMFVAIFVVMFMLLMSGVFTPIAGMPEWAKVIAYAEPLTYFVRFLRILFLKGGGWSLVCMEFIVLSCFALLNVLLAFLSYRKRG